MNTASLSGILTHVGALTDADVRELEKLAESFPYCQTAHVLLAKALHDRGSVLAGQKLRRAATAAADRRVLRRLLMAPPSSPIPETEPDAPATLAVDATGELIATPPAALVAAPAVPAEAAPAVTPVVEDFIAEPATVVELENEPTPVIVERAAAESATPAEPEIPVEAPAAVEPVAPPRPEPLPTAVLSSELPAEVPEVEGSETETPAPLIADFDLVPDTSPAAVDLLLFAADELSLPPVGTSPAALTLFPEATAEPVAPVAPPTPALAPDPAVWYAMANSRLGFELTAADFVGQEERATDFPNPPLELLTEWLPAAPPDARWTEHAAAHQPPRPPRRPFDYQFALIDRFLREKPRLRTVDPTRPLPEKLPDLAQRAVRPDSEVVSESMARILARQGKTARAISMYEQLQARLPEKAAIFAAQITALRGAAE